MSKLLCQQKVSFSNSSPVDLRVDVPGTVRVVSVDQLIFLDSPIFNSLVHNFSEQVSSSEVRIASKEPSLLNCNEPESLAAQDNCVVVVIGPHHFVVSFGRKNARDPVDKSRFEVECYSQPVWLVLEFLNSLSETATGFANSIIA